MSQDIGAVPRAHHFVPQCWLAGFTYTGDKSGRLWVTDLRRRKQWQSNPANAGHRRDFYRVADPRVDPLYFENAFGEIENSIAPVLRTLYQEQRPPDPQEIEGLLCFAAVMFARVPAFRSFILELEQSILKSYVSKALESPKSWAKALKRARIRSDAPGASYEQMKRLESDGYTMSAENEWFLYRGFKAADDIIPMLRARHWGTQLSPGGNYIASDSPVALDGPAGQKVGFENADIMFFPVNRHISLHGTKRPVVSPPLNRWRIAAQNTFTMLSAEEQVYSHRPDFCWLDKAGGYQTDWALFDKAELLTAISSGNWNSRFRTFIERR